MQKCKMHAPQDGCNRTQPLCQGAVCQQIACGTCGSRQLEDAPWPTETGHHQSKPWKALLETHLALLPANVSCILPCQETPHVRIPCASHAPVLEVVMTDARKNPLSPDEPVCGQACPCPNCPAPSTYNNRHNVCTIRHPTAHCIFEQRHGPLWCQRIACCVICCWLCIDAC
jgi:hypothetical protein